MQKWTEEESPIKIILRGKILLDLEELPESQYGMWCRAEEYIKNLDLEEGYYYVKISYDKPTNKTHARFKRTYKQYLVRKNISDNVAWYHAVQFPLNIDFMQLKAV